MTFTTGAEDVPLLRDRMSPLEIQKHVPRSRSIARTVSIIGLAAAGASFALSSYYRSDNDPTMMPDTFNVRQVVEHKINFAVRTSTYDVVSEDGFTVTADRPGAGYPSISDRRTVEPQRDTIITVISRSSGNVEKAARKSRRRLSNDDDGDGFKDDEADQFNDDTNLELDDDADEYAADDDKISGSTKVVKEKQLTHCDWRVELLNGGGVYDDIPAFGEVPARDWSPSGKVMRVTRNEFSLMEFTVRFPSPGSYKVSLDCHFDDQTIVAFDDNVDAYYVRRELRDLKMEDRNAFLDSFMKMHMTPTEDGVRKYGRHYRSLVDFEREHLGAAAARDLDHIHDGQGFLTQHMSLTAEFELALQSVWPSGSVPYWDYTIDSAKVETEFGHAEISSIFKYSDLFQDDFFGKTDSEAHTVTEGRFAHMELHRDYNFTTKSPYGLLRAPWNINPNKFITRYHKICGLDTYDNNFTSTSYYDLMWPSCDLHFKYTNGDDFGSWYDWIWGISYLPHGPVHAWIGGIGGECDTFSSLETRGYLNAEQTLTLKHGAFALLKQAWRSRLIETPKFCAHDAPVEDCMWTCVGQIWANPDAQMYLNKIASISTADINKEVAVKAFCDTPFWPGDHLEAGSPSEASFWPIHPTLERLLQYKDIIRPFEDKGWVPTGNYAVDDWKACEYDTTGCDGHHAEDLTFWKVVSQDIDSGEYHKSHYTNQEVREFLLPQSNSYTLPYIYDNFKWEHCDALGIHFKNPAEQEH